MVGYVCFYYSVVYNVCICLDCGELKIIVNIFWMGIKRRTQMPFRMHWHIRSIAVVFIFFSIGSNIYENHMFFLNPIPRTFLQKPQMNTRGVAGKSGSNSDPPFQLPARFGLKHSEVISKYSWDCKFHKEFPAVIKMELPWPGPVFSSCSFIRLNLMYLSH